MRRDRSERRARYRGRWWFPLLIVGHARGGFLGRAEGGPAGRGETGLAVARRTVRRGLLVDRHRPQRPGGRLTIVVGGLNRTSGTGVALALLPSLEADGSRVFSLVYGSGINDQDIRDKFDALVAEVKPREVSFFGSSMGGDVVLNMAAHAQQNRDQYVQDNVLGGRLGTDRGPVTSRCPMPDRSPVTDPLLPGPPLDRPARRPTARQRNRQPHRLPRAGSADRHPAPGWSAASRSPPWIATGPTVGPDAPAPTAPAEVRTSAATGTGFAAGGTAQQRQPAAGQRFRHRGSGRSTSTAHRWAPMTSGTPAAPRPTP